MQLLIVRHGKAEESSPSGKDVDRRLTERGHAQARHVASVLSSRTPAISPPPAAIFASPAARADATARVISEVLRVPVQHDDRLLVDEPVDEVLQLIIEHARTDAAWPLMLVGHNPQLSGLLDALAPGDPLGRDALRTGELVVLRLAIPVHAPLSGAVLARERLDD